MKYYIYPSYNPHKNKSGNKYILYFHEAFKKRSDVLNNRSNLGVISLFFNLKADIFIFHWIDLIISYRFGCIQTILFWLGLLLLKIKQKKIVLVLHNKKPHQRGKDRINIIKIIITNISMYLIARQSYLVITHANEGVTYFKKKYSNIKASKVHFIPHPVYDNNIYQSNHIKWDYIIWGNISRYKNIVKFLKSIQYDEIILKRKILICGFCNDNEYLNEIYKNLHSNITFIN